MHGLRSARSAHEAARVSPGPSGRLTHEEKTTLRVLIAGCGYVGCALAERLVASGHRVYGLRRSPDALPAGVTPERADLARPETLRDLPSVDCAFYAAAADRGDEDAYRTAYVEGPRNLLEALGAPAASLRFIYVSSTAVYAQDDGAWIDENSATEPTRFNGRVVLEGETLVRAVAPEATIVRFGGIYGPGRTRLIESVRSGAARLSAVPQYTNRIHRDDCAGALHHLMEHAPLDSLYLGVDSEPVLRDDVLGWLADQMGVEKPSIREAGDGLRRAGSKRCSNARLRATGYRFRYPTFREGYGELL